MVEEAAEAVEAAEAAEVEEYMEAAGDEVEESAIAPVSVANVIPGVAMFLDEKKVEYDHLPKLTDEEPDFSAKSADEQRDWLRHHGVKGTWQKKLLTKCHEVWEDMMAVVRLRSGPVAATMEATEGEAAEEPNFEMWPMERKRAFLRRRDVKGIWSKYVDEKCLEIWRLEKSGEKYVHTPPSLGRSGKSRFPGAAIMMTPLSAGHTPMSSPIMHIHHHQPLTQGHLHHIPIHHMNMNASIITDDQSPMTISPLDFHELAGAAQKSDLKRVTDLLNNWSAKNMLPEEANQPQGDDALVGHPVEYHWINQSALQQTPINLHKKVVRRTGSLGATSTTSTPAATPAPKRRKAANGAAVAVDASSDDLREEIALLHQRVAELEAQNQQLLQENNSMKTKNQHAK